MHLLHQLAARQLGQGSRGSSRSSVLGTTSTNFLGPRCPTSYYALLPSSSFAALSVTGYYRFLDETIDAPPLAMQIAGTRLGLVNDLGDVALVEKNSLAELARLRAHNSAIFDFKWRGLNQHEPGTIGGAVSQFLTCSGDRSIKVWDAERSGKAVQEMPHAHQSSVKTFSFYDANLLASGGRDGKIKLWDLRCSVEQGPKFAITDVHIFRLPSGLNSPGFGSNTSGEEEENPLFSGLANMNQYFLPSNVVTCVGFEPSYNYHLYSSGISDSTIKIWDIRKCNSNGSFQTTSPLPVKYHTIKQCTSGQPGPFASAASHGFRSFIFQHSTKYGNVLLGAATDSKIYAFLPGAPWPVMVYSGHCANHFTRIATFGDQYLLSGDINGRVFIWQSDLTFPTPDPGSSTNDDQHPKLLLENRRPLYELDLSSQIEISLVAGDTTTSTIYNSTTSQLLYKWNFLSNVQLDEEKRIEDEGGIPVVRRCTQPAVVDQTKVISIKPPSGPVIRNTSQQQGGVVRGLPSGAINPKSLITSYISVKKRTNLSSCLSNVVTTTKRRKTESAADNTASKRVQRNCRSASSNHKISEYFAPLKKVTSTTTTTAKDIIN